MVATAAHLLDKARALDALAKAADQVDRCFAVVFSDFCVYRHVAR